jgi:hypothetical protein
MPKKLIVEMRARHSEDDACHFCGEQLITSGIMLLDTSDIVCEPCILKLRKFTDVRDIDLRAA